MLSILLSIAGISLIIFAYFPDFAFRYKINKSATSGDISANESRRICKMVEEFEYSCYCHVFGRLLLKKTILLFMSFLLLIVSIAQLIIICPIEFPVLLSIVLFLYIWVFSACRIMLKCIRNYKLPFWLSLSFAITIPPCVYGGIAIVMPLIYSPY